MATFSYADLIEWSKQLPDWQRDALRRVLAQKVLKADDITQLTALAFAPYLPGGIEGLEAIPASEAHIPPAPAGFPAVRLVAVRDIARVNALGPGPVPFCPQPLTVIYGDNATGKTGVARILKKACRAKDVGGPIRANIFQPEPAEPATATIDFRVGGEENSFPWIDGAASDPHLATVNVFDARCAALQVAAANTILYTPEILQVFAVLAPAIDQVAEELRAKKRALGDRPRVLDDLKLDGRTTAGQYINTLGMHSDPEALAKICEVDPAEAEKLTALRRALADNPDRRAEAEEARARRIAELDAVAGAVATQLSDEACRAFRLRLSEREAAREAARAARETFAKGGLLAGLGTEAWRMLWEAARRYSREHAYPGQPFPVAGEESVCVLCQQPLLPEASQRLRSFEEFVTTDVQQRADQASMVIDQALVSLRGLPLPRSVRDVGRSVGLTGTRDGDGLRQFLVAAKLRRRQLFREAESKPIGVVTVLPPRPDLRRVVDAIRGEVGRLHAASKTGERLLMEQECAEFEARVVLGSHRGTVEAEIERLRAVSLLDTALAECRTQVITLKARSAAGLIITDQLRTAFASNLAAMGVSGAPVEVKLGAGEHGKHPYQMKLTARPGIPPEDVLSEGERTCVALAGFLAELETSGNSSAILFDDPVSSLDHQYRKRVAERLVREAKARQVVVFTHDPVFLFLLRKYAAELGLEVGEVSLERGYQGGHARATAAPPWFAMPVGQRVTTLRGDLIKARQALRDVGRERYELRAVDIYRRLRQAWERAVEEVLLYSTVLRFSDSVQTQRLSKLTDISDADVETVTKEMSRCSDFVHDEAGVVHSGVPDPDVIEADITRLAEWVKDLRKNRGRS